MVIAKKTVLKASVGATIFTLSLVFQFFLTTHEFSTESRSYQRVEPIVFSGDEPHYLLTINSILFDGDLVLNNNYESVRRGGLDAGMRLRGFNLEHQSLIMSTQTHEAHLWEDLFDYAKRYRCRWNDSFCIGFARISGIFPDYQPANPNYVEFPKHPIFFPAVIAATLSPFDISKENLEASAIYSVLTMSWLTAIITFFCALQLGFTFLEALATFSVLVFCSSWLVYSHELFPATFMGLLLVFALMALIRKYFVLASAMIVLASFQSEAFILILPVWTGLLFLLKERKNAAVFLTSGVIFSMVVGAVNRFFVGKATTRHFDITFDLDLLWRTYFVPNGGVFLFNPWVLVPFLFLLYAFFQFRRTEYRVFTLMAAGIFPIAGVYMLLPYVGQVCYGPRYWIPFLPWLALTFLFALRKLNVTIKIASALLVFFSLCNAMTAVVLPSRVLWDQPFWRSYEILFRFWN